MHLWLPEDLAKVWPGIFRENCVFLEHAYHSGGAVAAAAARLQLLEALSLQRRHDCNSWKRCRCSGGTIAIPGSVVAAVTDDCNCWKRCRCSDGTNAIAGSAVAAEKKGGLPGGSVFLESGGHLRKVFCRRFSLRKIRGPTSWKYISRVWMPSVQSLL